MNQVFNLTRRQALLALLASFALPLSPREGIAAVSLKGKSYDILDVMRGLTRILSDRDSAAELGHRYLDAYPEHNSIAYLVASLTSNVRIANSCMDEHGIHAYRKIIREAITHDFDTENIIMLDGWILACTEVQLCGLATYD